MTNERPRITDDLILVSLIAHEVRKTTIMNPGATAKLVGTSKAYLELLRSCGCGPKFFEKKGRIWYVLADIQDWLGMVVEVDRGVGHVQ